MSKTAADFLNDLSKSEKYNLMKKNEEEHFFEMERIYKNDEKNLVSELNSAGFLVGSVWDFVNSKNHYLDAEKILVKHLNRNYHPKILAGIARSLAVPEFSNNEELWELLVDLYKKTQSDSKIDTPEERGAQEAIAIALECLANKSRIDSLEKLVTDLPNADGMDLLIAKIFEFRK